MAHKVGIIGLGGAGLGHLRYWPANGVTVGAICDTQAELVRRRASEFDLKRAYQCSDYRDLLAHSDCDIISICTPDHLHSEQAIAALQSGRHVQVEKPIASSRAQVRALLDAAASTKAVVGLHYQLRFFWLYREIHRLIRAGALGDVYAVEADYFHNIRVRTFGTSRWREDSSTVQPVFSGVGGTHFVDLMRWFIADEVESVDAVGTRSAWPEYPAESHVSVVLKFRNGAIGKTAVNIGSALPKQHPTKVFGTRACVDDVFLFSKPNSDRPERWLGSKPGTLSRGRLRTPLTKGLSYLLRKAPVRLERYPFSSYEHVESCTAVVRNFIRTIDGLEQLDGTLEDAARDFCVCEAVEESLRRGERVRVDYALNAEAQSPAGRLAQGTPS